MQIFPNTPANAKILLLEGIHPTAIQTFKEAGFTNIESLKPALSEVELLKRFENEPIHFLGIRSKTHITASIIAAAQKNLCAIGCFCIGTNQVDLKNAAKEGIAVFNSPYSNTRSVAELVIAEIILLLRKITEKNNAAHAGKWLKDTEGCYEVRNKTLGIIGYGHIGSQVSVLAEALGMRVLYYDIIPKLPMGNATATKKLDDLLTQSDIVTLHVPATLQTNNLINEQKISLMKKGAYLLNLSRGSVVEIQALANALKNNHLAGAAIDVFPHEPESKNEPFISALQNIPNVILTPHIGGSTLEAQESIGLDVAHKMIEYLKYGITTGSHSLPALSTQPLPNTHRIMHIHENVPGVLSAINNLISSQNINIVGQALKTNEEIGYVILDIENGTLDIHQVMKQLQSIKHTISTQFLY